MIKGYYSQNAICRKDRTMDINATFKAIAQYRLLEEEARAEREALEAEIKAYMTESGVAELIGDEHKATYKEVTSSRFDSKAFKEDHADIYESYKKPSTSMRFTFA